MGQGEQQPRAISRADGRARRGPNRCLWCGGPLIVDELHEAGQWWSEPRCLQRGRVPGEHQPALRRRAVPAPRDGFPRSLRGWRSLMERPSHGGPDEEVAKPAEEVEGRGGGAGC